MAQVCGQFDPKFFAILAEEYILNTENGQIFNLTENDPEINRDKPIPVEAGWSIIIGILCIQTKYPNPMTGNNDKISPTKAMKFANELIRLYRLCIKYKEKEV